jgi:TPR repeat protein
VHQLSALFVTISFQLLLQCRSAQTKTLLDPLASFALFRNMNVLFMLMGLEIKSRSERQLEFQWSNFFENEYEFSCLRCICKTAEPERFSFHCRHSVFGEISAQLPQPMRPESHSFKLSSKALNQIIGSSSMLSFAMVLKYFSGDNRILELGQPLSRRCFMFCLFTQGMFSSHCVDEKLGIPCDSLGSSLGRFLFEATEAPCVMLEDLLVVCSQLNQHIPGSGEEFGAVQKPVREALKFVLYVCVCFAKVLFKQRIKCEHVLQMPLLLEYIDQFSAFLFECAKPATVSIREKVHMFARSAFGSAVLLTTRSRDVSLDIVKRFFLASAYVLFWHDVKTDHGDGCEDEIEEYHQAVCDVIGEHVAIGSQLRVFVDALRNANQLDGTLDGIIDILGSENDEMQATKKWEYDEFASFVFKKDGSCVDLQTFDVSCSVIVVPPAVREKTLRLLSPLDADRLHATCKVSSVLGHTRYELSLSNDTKKLDKPLKLHFWNWNKAQDTNILKIPEFTEYLRNLDYEELHRSMFCTLFSIHKPLCEFFTRSFFSRMDSYFSKTFQSGAVSVICHSVIGIFFSAFEIVFFPNMNAADGRAFPLLLVYEWFAHVYPQSRDDGDDDDGQELEHTHLRKRLVFSNSKAFTWRKHVDMDGGVFPSPERDFLSAEFSTSESYTNSSAANESIVCDRGFLVASTDLEGFVPSCLLQKRQYWLTDSKIVSSPVNSDVFGTIEIEKGTASKSVTVASITDCCVLFLVNIVSPMISQRMGTLTRIFSAIEEMNHVLFWSRSCTSAVPCRIQLPRLQLTFNNIDGKFVIVIQEELALVESNAELTHILPRHLHPFMSTSLLLTNAVHDLFLLVPCSFVSATRLNVTGHLFNTDMDNIIVAARATSPFIVYRLNRFGLGLSNTLPLSPAALYASLLHCIFRTHEEADRLADDQKLSSTNGSSSFLDPSSQIKSTLFSHEELVSSLNKLAHDPGGRWVESDRLLLEIMKKFSSSQNDHHTHEISASILHQEPHKSVKAGDTVHERSSPVAASVICSPHEEFPPSLSQLQQVQSLFDKGQRLYGEQRFSDAAKSFEQAVEMKHVHSHALLSSLLIEGRPDVPKDTKRAFELALAGTALGCAHSKGALGRCYMGGFGVAEDHAKAYALGIESAAAGSCIGQHVVGVAYDNGYGVEQDKAEAVRWWRLAAVQGYAVAQVNLGFMFIHGYGVAQDKVEAVRWLRLAAAQGHAGAQFKLGFMFANGFGVAQDKAEAVRWLRLAAVQLCAPAQYNLGVMFANGDGVAQDKAEAVRWYRLAAAQGDASAQFKLGFMFAYGDGVAQDKAEAVRWYRLAAAQGVARAQFRLGEMLDDGVVDAAPPTSAAVLWGVPGILEGIHGKEIEFWSQAEEAIFQDVPAKADIFDVIVECFSAETSFTPHPTLFLLRGLCTPLESHGSMTQMRYMIIVAMSLVRCGPMTSKRLTALCSGEGKYRFTLVRLAAAFFMFSLFTRRGHRTLSLDEDSNVSAETVLKRLQEFVDDCTKQQIAAIHPLQQSSSYNGAIFDAACLDLFVHVPASNLCVQQVQRDQCSANEWLHRRNTAKWTLFATPDLMKWSSQFDGDVQHFPALPDFDAVRALSPDSVLLQSAHDRFAKCLLENKRHEEQRLRFLVQQFMLFVNAFSEVNFDEICGNIDIACGNRRAFQFQDLVQMLIYRPRRCLLHCAFSHVQASLVSLMCAMCRVDLLSSCAQSLLQAPAADSSALTRVVDQLDNPRPLHFSRLKDTEDLIPRAGPGCVCHRDVTRVCECRHIQQPSVADVHLLAFEFANNIMIRRDQLDMVDAILSQCDNGQHAIVHQAIMGCGKTSVICPLLALKLSDRTPSRLVVVVCPPNLLLQTSNQLREKLCLAFRKGVNTFVFDRFVLQHCVVL